MIVQKFSNKGHSWSNEAGSPREAEDNARKANNAPLQHVPYRLHMALTYFESGFSKRLKDVRSRT